MLQGGEGPQNRNSLTYADGESMGKQRIDHLQTQPETLHDYSGAWEVLGRWKHEG